MEVAEDHLKRRFLRKFIKAGFAAELTERGVRLNVNTTFKHLLPELTYPPSIELPKACSFAELVLSDSAFDLVAKGHQEGIVLLEQDAYTQCYRRLKWKNGHEPAGTNKDTLLQVESLFDDPEMTPLIEAVFDEAEDLRRIKRVIKRMLIVYENNSRIDLNADRSVREVVSKKGNKSLGREKKANRRKQPSRASQVNKAYADAISR